MATAHEEPKAEWRPTEEHWKTLSLHQRWTLIVLTIQATAAAGTFVAALFGLWTVSPIISYRIQQQERLRQIEGQAITLPATHPVAASFVEDTHRWWQERIDGYSRVLEVLASRQTLRPDISYQIVEAPQLAGVAESVCDVLVLTATSRDGKSQVIEVPVNENVMPLTQYIQYKVNHGAFSELAAPQRERVEEAIRRYMRFYMVPGVRPPYIGANMSLDEIQREIEAAQNMRVDTMKHIQALSAVIDVSLLE